MTNSLRPGEMRQLTHAQCLELLATQQIGRLGVNAQHYPLIFPVNYAMDRDVVVIRTGPGTKLSEAAHANVTFEVDEIDQFRRTGWSVIVRGVAEEVTPAHRAELIRRTLSTGVEPWAPGEHGHWLRIIPTSITGRWVIAGELPPVFEPAAYL
jgi:nitroimidazol reductase NimA-like FMN-containing flavoprotein (pyridoxamine 5'-phosphate oxidase superfamily)